MNQPKTDDKLPAKKCKLCQRTFAGDAEACPEHGTQLEDLVGEDPLVGTVFADKYEILSVLGRGGMSVVYKARHKYMNRIVALKLLLENFANDQVAFKRFQQESQASSALSHQNIVSVHDFGLGEHGQAYFVMDCLEGASLEDLIDADGRVELKRAIDIFRQVCDGLQHAHKKGIIHRDLKPSNIVLIREEDGTECAKIVDFGIAKICEQDKGEKSLRLTETGQVFGSPLYMSPEQCQGYPLDARSDIYSLGCLMYETLAGVVPFSADSFFNTALLHVHQAPPPFDKKAPEAHVPKEIEQVVFKCLEKDAASRFESADHLRQKLLDAALASGLPGLKPGAVLTGAQKKTGKSTLGQTWENVRAVVDARLKSEQKQSVSPFRLIGVSAATVVLFAITAQVFLYPGPEGDQGTNFNKMRWQLLMTWSQHDIDAGNFGQADSFLKEAKAIATDHIHDGMIRLRQTVEQQAKLYHKWDKFADEQKANEESANILTRQVLDEEHRFRDQLLALADPTKKENFEPAQLPTNQLHAKACAENIMLSSKRLYSRYLYQEDETLLEQSISAFQRLQLGDSPEVAAFKIALADALIAQQRLPEVKPILEDALNIRRRAATDNQEASANKLITALLKIGQFERDQSDFSDSEKHLKEALDLAEKRFSKSTKIMPECLYSYADLKRQTGDKEAYEKLVARAKSLKKGNTPSDTGNDGEGD